MMPVWVFLIGLVCSQHLLSVVVSTPPNRCGRNGKNQEGKASLLDISTKIYQSGDGTFIRRSSDKIQRGGSAEESTDISNTQRSTGSHFDDADTQWGQAIPKPSDDERGRETDSEMIEEDDIVEVAIVGGSFAGLAAAIGLTRCGIDFRIYERAPKLRTSSQGIVGIWPNGFRALESIHPSLPELVTKAGCDIETITISTIHDKEGHNVTDRVQRKLGGSTTNSTFRPLVVLPWNRLQKTLTSLLNRTEHAESAEHVFDSQYDDQQVTIFTNRSLQYFVDDPHSDTVRLYFEDGTVVRAYVVLACDGIFSVARRKVYADCQRLLSMPTNVAHYEDSPIFFGQLNWASIIPTDQIPPNLHRSKENRYIMYSASEDDEQKKRRWMSMIIDGDHGETFWQFRVADPKFSLSLSGNEGRGGLGLPGVKRGLLPVAAPSPDVAAIIEHTPEEQIFERSIVGRLPLKTWRSNGGAGRVLLLGDSAHGMHPNIGQGVNSVFESVSALVQSVKKEVNTLRKAKGNPSNRVTVDSWNTIFTDFEKRRKPRVDLVQRFANIMGVAQATGFNPLSTEQNKEIFEWVHDYPYNGDDKVDLPSPEVIQIIEEFDLFQQPGISPLW